MSSALSRLSSLAEQWHVAVDKTWETTESCFAFGTRGDTSVVLKISKRRNDEWHAGDILRSFDGGGTVRVYESEPGAVLLERLDPAKELVELVRAGNDDEATEILAQLMRQMSQHSPPSHCQTLLDWSRGFDRYLETGDPQLPGSLVREAHELYLSLANSQQNAMLLHGDLHHYNVLFDSTRGWVSIDPKGLVGELEYEVGAILRNPVENPDFFASTTVVKRRLNLLTAALKLNYDRALRWSFAQAVLSAIWVIEDGDELAPNNPSLRLVHALAPLINHG